MTRQEWRSLRIQVLLMGGLIAGCTVAAIVTATQRGFFEKYLYEKYAALPASLQPLAEAAAQGTLKPRQLAELSENERLLLYDHWMAQADLPSAAMPRSLLAADPDLYIARVERTLVCGRQEQRERALEFLERGGRPDSVPMLRRAAAWAGRRNFPDLAARIQETVQRLEATAAEPLP